MAIVLTIVNSGSEEVPDVSVYIEEQKKDPYDTWFRRRWTHRSRNIPLTPALVQIESAKIELEEIAAIAFQLGRNYERETQKGKTLEPYGGARIKKGTKV